MDTKTQIIDVLKATKRPGIDNLIEWMDQNGFFSSPCSGQYHLAKEGGLAEHSMNVFKTLMELAESLCVGTEVTEEEIAIVALLHDLGKTGDHGKPNYVPNILKTGQSKSKPYKTNPDLTYEEHEIRSVLIAERFIQLSEDEETAILHHNGLYGKLDSSFGNHNYDKTKLAFLLHTADMWCSRFVETDGEEEES